MPAEPTIRAATIDDYDSVGSLLRERVAGLVDPDIAEMFVAVVGDLVGLATVRIEDNPNAPMFRPGRRANMIDLVVAQEFRSSGIAKLLLGRVIE